MIQIGTYSKKIVGKGSEDPFTSIQVNIPKGRKVGGRYYPYKSHYLTDDYDDIEKDLKKELKLSNKVKLIASSKRGGKIMVV